VENVSAGDRAASPVIRRRFSYGVNRCKEYPQSCRVVNGIGGKSVDVWKELRDEE